MPILSIYPNYSLCKEFDEQLYYTVELVEWYSRITCIEGKMF